MGDLWLTIKAWFKGLLFLAILIYAVIFTYHNSGESVNFWWWFKGPQQTTVFFLTSGAFIAGVVFSIVLRTTWATWRQISDLRGRSRTGKLEREMADMKAKAAMLQTRPVAGDGGTGQSDRLGSRPSSENLHAE
jgi:hypothetical protein